MDLSSYFTSWYPKNPDPTPVPFLDTLEYMTTSYLENAPTKLKADIELWNCIWVSDPHNRLFEMELDYKEHSIHLRILSLDDLWPLYHIHYWAVPNNIIDTCRDFGKQYLKQGSLSYIYK